MVGSERQYNFSQQNNSLVTWQLEGTLETPWQDLEHSSLRLEGKPQEGGYRNHLVLEGAGQSYQGDLFWKYRDENDWEVDVRVSLLFWFVRCVLYTAEGINYSCHMQNTNIHLPNEKKKKLFYVPRTQ